MRQVSAWLLSLGGAWAAIGEGEMVHLLADPPTLHTIPRSPAYCREVLIWEGEILPLMDLARRVHGDPRAPAGPRGPIAITAFAGPPGALPGHGALLLHAPPVRIRVSDAQACPLPEPEAAWRPLTISCFEQEGLGPIPVLDLARVFLLAADGQPR
jgi:chemotaxis signal transduction protein